MWNLHANRVDYYVKLILRRGKQVPGSSRREPQVISEQHVQLPPGQWLPGKNESHTVSCRGGPAARCVRNKHRTPQMVGSGLSPTSMLAGALVCAEVNAGSRPDANLCVQTREKNSSMAVERERALRSWGGRYKSNSRAVFCE